MLNFLQIRTHGFDNLFATAVRNNSARPSSFDYPISFALEIQGRLEPEF